MPTIVAEVWLISRKELLSGVTGGENIGTSIRLAIELNQILCFYETFRISSFC